MARQRGQEGGVVLGFGCGRQRIDGSRQTGAVETGQRRLQVILAAQRQWRLQAQGDGTAQRLLKQPGKAGLGGVAQVVAVGQGPGDEEKSEKRRW